MNNDARPHWHLVGAGHIGLLAARYLIAAGHGVTVVRAQSCPQLTARFVFADGRPERTLRLPVIAPGGHGQPVTHLIVACKTPFTAAALARCRLADDATVIRLQNGLGTLDGRLGPGMRLIEAVTTSAVKTAANAHEVVAENETWMGGSRRPDWCDTLAPHWPGLQWVDDVRPYQRRKLVANAAINPLTALHDVPNGALLDDAALRRRMAAIVAEADAVLGRLDPAWPGASRAHVEAVAEATARNTSSMRADVQRGAPTEIEAINGWLLEQARRLGLDLPENRRVVEALGRRGLAQRRDQ